MLREMVASVILFVSGFHGKEEAQPAVQPPIRRVVAIALDGVREKDIISSMTAVASRMHALNYQVHWYGKEQDCRVSQPFNISLPAYASIFSGRYDPRIRGNFWYGRLRHKTLFERFAKSQLFSSWTPIKSVMSSIPAIKLFAHIVEQGIGQDDRVLELFIRSYNGGPFAFVHFVDADDFAHLRMKDSYKLLAEREAYKALQIMEHVDKLNRRDTLFIIMTDHSRGSGALWHSHGRGIPGSEDIWAMVVSPVPLENPLADCSHHGIHDLIVKTLK